MNSQEEEGSPELSQLDKQIDLLFLTMNAIIVFKIHLGFTFLEGGFVRIKNVQTITYKCLADVCVNTVGWWLIGYGFAFGDDSGSIVGTSKFSTLRNAKNQFQIAKFMFTWGLMSISSKIISGCIAERMTIRGYLLFSLFQSCWIFPSVAHAAWGGGILQKYLQYYDHAGGGVVHLQGGVCGLVCVLVLGPRKGRFDSEHNSGFRPSNIPLLVFGSLVLWFAFYGLIVGANLSPIGAENVNKVITLFINTTLSASSAALFSWIFHCLTLKFKEAWEKLDSFYKAQYSVPTLCLGFINGLVTMTAIGSNADPIQAAGIGSLSSLLYYISSLIIFKLKVDDPLDAVSVHLVGGLTGLLIVGVKLGTCEYQMASALVIIIWVGLNTFLALKILDKLGILFENQQIQQNGQDNHYFDTCFQQSEFSPKEIAQTVNLFVKYLEYRRISQVEEEEIGIYRENPNVTLEMVNLSVNSEGNNNQLPATQVYQRRY